MVTTATIAEIGALLGDPARINMMIALLDGRALTASELAEVAGVAPQTASSHLGKLLAAEMIQVERQGRHRFHRLASAEIAQLLEQMHVAGEALARTARRQTGPRDPAMREARSCYDHLAGRIAVEIGGQLLASATRARGEAQLTDEGRAKLHAIGVDLSAAALGKRRFCLACLDWSERRPHLAGAVGAAMLDRLIELSWVRRRAGTRTLSVTPAGQQGFRQVFGVAHLIRPTA
jgi:DNA-binding transcriptional ArsR family regulator